MYTATIKKKEYVGSALKVTVLFTDGVDSVTETCIPQDFNGLKFWIKSRLDTFNSGKEIDATFPVDSVIDPYVEPEPPVPTAEELQRADWFKNYNKWVKVKSTMIDTGILTGNEPQAVALLNKVKADFKVVYLNFM